MQCSNASQPLSNHRVYRFSDIGEFQTSGPQRQFLDLINTRPVECGAMAEGIGRRFHGIALGTMSQGRSISSIGRTIHRVQKGFLS